MVDGCGSHRYRYVTPRRIRTDHVRVPRKETPVRRSVPGLTRWKLWLLERSLITNLCVPALILVTLTPAAFLSVMTALGPTVP
jgi:hypothetical protein